MAGVDSGATYSDHVREKRERRRAEILHAAFQTFREKGYHRTTLEDIAERLGVRKTALYHYFPDKESILFACHRESLSEVVRLLDEAGAIESPAQRLAFLIKEHVRVMTETLEGSPLAFEVTSLSPVRRAEIIAERDRYERGLREIILQGIAVGEFRPVDAKITVFAILGAINWIARWYDTGGSVRGAELGSAFADYLLGGLRCR
ncbi:MAG: TetR/AcrR family transcriptional regulator [Gemmatimonadales bacterium]